MNARTRAFTQNIAILVTAAVLSIYFRNGWGFLLLLLWLSPGEE